MSELTAGFTLDFLSRQQADNFALVVGDELGSVPIQVSPKIVGIWSRNPDHYGKQIKTTLRMTKPGVRRLRLYCAKEAAKTARLSVHTGTAALLGRRQTLITETLTWTNKHSQALRFTYDNPTAVVVDKTRFFTIDGQEVEPPTYISSQAMFHHEQEVTGALVVEYSPEYSLFEVTYGMGEEQMEPERFKEMKLAWLAGNIRDSDIPPVHVIAMAEGHATQISFQRQFWPEGSLGKRGYASDSLLPSMDMLPLLDMMDLDPAWKKCLQFSENLNREITPADYPALLECYAALNDEAPLQYVETERKTKVERLYNQNNPDVYIDVERPITLTMSLARADGQEFQKDWDSYPYLPEISLRFNN